ncbi:hypothetical protein WJX84_010778 [Apatococcus fuscideae]|uniref:SAP domain-containing protein n=1 Tax=Apatococcus fuscideae TaxID=2026836 RepID=A0AAW1SJJ2_9CHLO
MGDYESLKVVELKEELRKRELTVSGKKVELIARLQAHDEDKGAGGEKEDATPPAAADMDALAPEAAAAPAETSNPAAADLMAIDAAAPVTHQEAAAELEDAKDVHLEPSATILVTTSADVAPTPAATLDGNSLLGEAASLEKGLQAAAEAPDQVMADPAIAPATAPVDALASLDTIVSEALAPVEPAAAMQEEAMEELVDYGAEPLADEAVPAAASMDVLQPVSDKDAQEPRLSIAKEGADGGLKRPSVFDRLQAGRSQSLGGSRSLGARQASQQVTRALRIDGFVRPFQEKQARALIAETGGDLESFWMPTIRTTAWVVFSSEDEAEATFKAVWGKEWPLGNRSRLNPQYVSVDEAFSKAELGGGQIVRRQGSGSQAPAAANGDAVGVHAPAQGAAEPRADTRRHEGHRASGAGRHAAEAAGEAAEDSKAGRRHETSERRQRPFADRRGPSGPEVAAPPQEEAVPTLDTLFKKTATRPFLYWLPLSESQRAARDANSTSGSLAPDKGAVSLLSDPAKISQLTSISSRGRLFQEPFSALAVVLPLREAPGPTKATCGNFVGTSRNV